MDNDLYNRYFKIIAYNKDYIKKGDLYNKIIALGISIDDNRFNGLLKNIKEELYIDDFKDLMESNFILFSKMFENTLIISDWVKFMENIENIYNKTKLVNSGNVASYIPQLANVNSELYGVHICSIDGQLGGFGNTDYDFCVQSCSKPFTYLIANDIHNPDYIHNFVGREPSGRNFNELCLNDDKIPHNPLINSGAIMSASLVDYKDSLADRFDKVLKYWYKLAGKTKVNFNTPVYLSERDTADRNYCLAYMMQESKAFSQGKNSKNKRDWCNKDLENTLDFYFQCCSIEIDCKQASIIAGTLANGGICPITNERVFDKNTVKNTLSLMSSCGMYDYSGEWAYTIGIPAKSGVSGLIIGVVPNMMGIAVFSPKLDELGNSSKGIEFFKELCNLYPLHTYDTLTKKKNYAIMEEDVNIYLLLLAASKNDLNSIKSLYCKGTNLNSADYDGRTALHLACSEINYEMVEFLLKMNVDRNMEDRWNNTPLDDLYRLRDSNSLETTKLELIELLIKLFI